MFIYLMKRLLPARKTVMVNVQPFTYSWILVSDNLTAVCCGCVRSSIFKQYIALCIRYLTWFSNKCAFL